MYQPVSWGIVFPAPAIRTWDKAKLHWIINKLIGYAGSTIQLYVVCIIHTQSCDLVEAGQPCTYIL